MLTITPIVITLLAAGTSINIKAGNEDSKKLNAVKNNSITININTIDGLIKAIAIKFTDIKTFGNR